MPALSWYWLRVAPRRALLDAYGNGAGILASPAWQRLDLVASPAVVANLQALALTLLNGQWAGGGMVGEGSCAEVLDYLQQAYEEAGDAAQAARLAEWLVTRFDLDEPLAIDFYEPALHPGAEFGWTQPYD